MSANLRIKFESGMIVILLTAPRLAKPLTHELISQLLGHSLSHTHDSVPQYFTDGLVLPEPAHLTKAKDTYLQQELLLYLVHY